MQVPVSKSKKSNNKYPERWRRYSGMNSVIDDTLFLPFKTPLESRFFANKPAEDVFMISNVVEQAYALGVKLGLVIDLTASTRYYDPAEWAQHNVEYTKLPIEGHEIHKKRSVCANFDRLVNDFRRRNKDPDAFIGVHCTHGVNRTGYLICRYLIVHEEWTAADAVAYFEEGRGERIDRAAYIEDLKAVEKRIHGKYRGSNNGTQPQYR